MRKSYLLGSLSLLAMAACAAADEQGSGAPPPKTFSVKDALHKLDVENDGDWTEGGLPLLSRVRELTGKKDLTRTEINEVIPRFERSNAHVKQTGSTDPNAGKSIERQAADAKAKNEGRAEKAPASIDDMGLGNPNDAMNNAEERNPEFSGGVEGKLDAPEYEPRSQVTAGALAEMAGDAILLFEAACLAAGTGRYGRNSALISLVRAYQGTQTEIKEIQARLDARDEQRQANNAEARRREADAAE